MPSYVFIFELRVASIQQKGASETNASFKKILALYQVVRKSPIFSNVTGGAKEPWRGAFTYGKLLGIIAIHLQ
jgi:hypothetical protein